MFVIALSRIEDRESITAQLVSGSKEGREVEFRYAAHWAGNVDFMFGTHPITL